MAAYYIRHSSIYANDDEFEETIGHFQQKLHKFRHTKKGRKQLSKASPLSFMAHWSSLINETSMERITPSGGQDALELGRRFAKRYPGLLPQKTESLEIFTADAERDIKSSRAFIKGLVPRHHGGDGSGDGHVKLKKVPTHDPKWSVNLTPHKICDSWSKKNGRSQRQQWEAIFTQPIIHRFNQLLPAFDFTTADVVAMFQLCGNFSERICLTHH